FPRWGRPDLQGPDVDPRPASAGAGSQGASGASASWDAWFQARLILSLVRRLYMSVLSFMAKRLRDSGRRKRTTVRKPPRHRLALEALDERILLSVTEFPIPDTTTARPEGIARGPDGNLWFAESIADRIGRITPAGVVTQFSLPFLSQPSEITAGPARNLW